MSIGEGAGTGFATMRGRSFPTIRQFTVFLENRVGRSLIRYRLAEVEDALAAATGDFPAELQRRVRAVHVHLELR